jgi:hypothetical protein
LRIIVFTLLQLSTERELKNQTAADTIAFILETPTNQHNVNNGEKSMSSLSLLFTNVINTKA